MAHNGVRHYHDGLVAKVGFPDGLIESLEIVAVHFHNLPAVGFPFGLQRLVHDLVDVAADLQLVVVDEGDQGKSVFDGRSPRFRDLAFLLLAVPHQAEDFGIDAFQSVRHGEAAGGGKPLAQVAGVPLDARHALLDVAREGAAGLAESDGRFPKVDEARAGQSGVDAGRGVAVRNDDEVSVRLLGILGIDFCALPEQGVHLQGGKRTAGVPAARQSRHLNDGAAADSKLLV